MAHAEICPVCKGKGYLQEIVTTDFGRDTTSPPSQESSTLTQRVCHGCNGRGWVEVSDYPTYPYPQPYTEPWDIPYPSPTWWTNATISTKDKDGCITFSFSV